MPTPRTLHRLTADEARAAREELCALLADAVEGGASVSFLAPLEPQAARSFWDGVIDAVAADRRVLLACRLEGKLVGAVQLDLATPPNQRHRAEVAKLLVLRSARRQGVGRALVEELERAARERGRTLLTLDTRAGDDAERLYRALGYQAAGTIPRYARSNSGKLEDTVVFFKELG